MFKTLETCKIKKRKHLSIIHKKKKGNVEEIENLQKWVF